MKLYTLKEFHDFASSYFNKNLKSITPINTGNMLKGFNPPLGLYNYLTGNRSYSQAHADPSFPYGFSEYAYFGDLLYNGNVNDFTAFTLYLNREPVFPVNPSVEAGYTGIITLPLVFQDVLFDELLFSSASSLSNLNFQGVRLNFT